MDFNWAKLWDGRRKKKDFEEAGWRMADKKEKKISGEGIKGNAILNKAKLSSDIDEWYTPYEEIVKAFADSGKQL